MNTHDAHREGVNKMRAWKTLVAEGRKLVAEDAEVRFALGDLALEVCPIGASGEGDGAVRLQDFADEIDFSYHTLRAYRQVAALWTPDSRMSSTSWTVHQILAHQHNRRQMIRPGMTTAQAKDLIRPPGGFTWKPPEPPDKPKQPDLPTELEVALTRAIIDNQVAMVKDEEHPIWQVTNEMTRNVNRLADLLNDPKPEQGDLTPEGYIVIEERLKHFKEVIDTCLYLMIGHEQVEKAS